MNCAAPGPVAPPINGSILAPFCGGAFKGKCGGGMGNWWSPSIAVLGDGVVVVTALGKSHTSTAHETPTFMAAFRSTDSGKSFGSQITLLPENGRVYVGGNLAYAAQTKQLSFVWTMQNNSGCKPACGVGNLSRLVSADGGQSWSDAGPLHDGDGRGIFSDGQLNGGLQKHHAPHQGRLVVTRELSYGPEPAVLPTPRGFKNTAGVVFSDDGGKTWSAGAPMPPPFEEGEAAVAELSNGSLVISARNGQNRSDHLTCAQEPCRVFARSDDGGATWARLWHVPYSALPAADCEAGMTHVDLPGHAAGALIFGFNMNTTTDDRTNYTLSTSLDGGNSWQWASGVYPYWAGYSAVEVLGPAQKLTDTSWRVDVGAAFQLTHNLGSHIETGGADLGWARRSLLLVSDNEEQQEKQEIY